MNVVRLNFFGNRTLAYFRHSDLVSVCTQYEREVGFFSLTGCQLAKLLCSESVGQVYRREMGEKTDFRGTVRAYTEQLI